MEDCSVYHPPGTWESPDGDIAYLGVYDGHGGRDMVEYLENVRTH
jgi:protein phosphatase